MKKTHINKTKKYLLILFSITFFTMSCGKKEKIDNENPINIPDGYAALTIETADILFQEEKLGEVKKASVRINNTLTIPRTNNKSISCIATLEPASLSNNNIKSSLKDNFKFAETKTKVFEKDIRYKVYAYDKNSGTLATSKSYIRGRESEAGPLLVIGGKDYIIVAYSINSKTEFPADIENASDINTATISNNQVEFMFQKQDVTITHQSNNTIKLKLKHQFAQINTIVKLDNTTRTYASIRGVGGASYFKPSYAKTKFKVSNSTITAENTDLNLLGSPVFFPFIPFDNFTTFEITNTQQTILNTPTAITDGKFTIEALTIGDVSRRVDIEDLNLLPGVKYNLILTFNVPETTIIGANPDFHFYESTASGLPTGHVLTHTVQLENPTFGAQIDIYFLDNSFNLKINDQNLFSRELNFEGLSNNQGRNDVFFSDNTYYNDRIFGTGRIDYIFRINPTRIKIPVVRLTIDEDGNVRLFGRKSMSENLRDLEIRNGVTINPLAKLIPNGMNTLTFSSTLWTITDVEGKIYGIRLKTP